MQIVGGVPHPKEGGLFGRFPGFPCLSLVFPAVKWGRARIIYKMAVNNNMAYTRYEYALLV